MRCKQIAAALAALLSFVLSSRAIAGPEDVNVDVSVYLVAETLICPNGYQAECMDITYETVSAWENTNEAEPICVNVPPERVSLGDLATAIGSYSLQQCTIHRPCTDPNDRKTVVMVFQFEHDIAGGSAWIERVSLGAGALPPYTSPRGEISEPGRWINYQRADAFLPSNNARWTIKVVVDGTEHEWSFVTFIE